MPGLNLRAVNWSRFPVRDRETGNTVGLSLFPPQAIIIDALQALSVAGKPMFAIILKSRRMGSSTICEAILTVHCAAYPNARAMTVAHQGKNARELFAQGRDFHRALADACSMEFEVTQQTLTFPHQQGDAYHTLATAKTIEGARGLTRSAVLASESPFYEQAENVFTALLPTVRYHSSNLVLIEGTANGKVGDGAAYYQYWMDAKERRNDLTPIFISWLNDPGNRMHASRGRPPYDQAERDLMKYFAATPEQIAFRRYAIPQLCQGSEEIFAQEYPSSDAEAFLTSGDPAFNATEIATVEKTTRKFKARLTGDIEELDGRIRVRYTKHDASLRIWFAPVSDHRYYIGADSARGKQHGDFAAAVIIDGTTGQAVATYAAQVPPKIFAYKLNLLGLYYNRAMMNLEVTGGDGAATLDELQMVLRYPIWYQWKGAKVDRKENRPPTNPHLGWDMTWKSRQRLIVVYREYIRDGDLEIYDPVILSQMQNCMRDDPIVRWEVTHGHDDVFVAVMLAAMAWHDYPPPRMRQRVGNLMGEDAQEALFQAEWAERLQQRALAAISGAPKPMERLAGI